MVALRQLSGIYLAAASAFVIAMVFQAHPVLKHDAAATANFVWVSGKDVAVATNSYVIQPSWKFARTESVALGEKIADEFKSTPQQQVAQNEPMAPRVTPRPRPVMHMAKLAPAKPIAPVKAEQHPARQLALVQPSQITTPAPQPALRSAESETPAQSAPQQDTQVASANPGSPKQMVLAPQATTTSPASQPGLTPDTATAVPNLPPPSPAELVRVEQRLKDSLTSEMLQNFGLFLYVSKAESGPLAQRMYVFNKQTNGDLVMLYNWPVSTGREQIEFNAAGAKLPTFTPAGYYELDPKRFYPHYRSMQWNQPMPYAMFFNWVKDGNQTGLAIHAAAGEDIAKLGQRASAGCIHLSPESARVLFTLIKTQYRGLAPRFAMDRRTGTMSNEGILLHDAGGHVQLADGYKVLVFIENYGGDNVVAALF